MSKFESDFDIDIVILWVDGSDPAWLKEKAEYEGTKISDANAVNRFRDWGLMKYWFRSVEAFAPWVRKIHFVTWGHVPDFLQLDHPKLHIVNHRDYLSHDCLPTFNSNAIEMSIHRIDGLAEHFIYFNDDMFLIRPVKPETFFRNGLPVVDGSEDIKVPSGKLLVWHATYFNNLGIINQHFDKRSSVKKNRGKYINRAYSWKQNVKTLFLEELYKKRFVGFGLTHAAAAYCKQSFEAVWEAEPEILRETSSHRFRTYTDVNQWLALWWQIASGQFYPGRVDNALFSANTWTTDKICQTICSQSHDMICINDPDNPTDFEITSKKIQAAFEAILPDKCSFEK